MFRIAAPRDHFTFSWTAPASRWKAKASVRDDHPFAGGAPPAALPFGKDENQHEHTHAIRRAAGRAAWTAP